MAKKSVTLKAIQQAFFESQNIGAVKTVAPKGKVLSTDKFPARLEFLADETEAVHTGNGVYKWTKASCKLNMTFQMYIKDIEQLISVKLLKAYYD